jgi:hypothetical protein
MATHAGRYATLDLPRPLRAAAPLLALAAAAALFDVDPRLPWLVGAFAASCFALAAVIRAGRARIELGRVRRAADRLIVHELRSRDASELVRWRCEELTSRPALDALRREVERLLRDLDPAKLPSASPLRRPAARANEPLLRAVAERLGESRPVAARGVLLVRSLLHDGGSPLYAEDAALLLPRALTRVLGALEP